jgi:hypothetical protein
VLLLDEATSALDTQSEKVRPHHFNIKWGSIRFWCENRTRHAYTLTLRRLCKRRLIGRGRGEHVSSLHIACQLYSRPIKLQLSKMDKSLRSVRSSCCTSCLQIEFFVKLFAGTHQDLVASQGFYYQLTKKQNLATW